MTILDASYRGAKGQIKKTAEKTPDKGNDLRGKCAQVSGPSLCHIAVAKSRTFHLCICFPVLQTFQGKTLYGPAPPSPIARHALKASSGEGGWGCIFWGPRRGNFICPSLLHNPRPRRVFWGPWEPIPPKFGGWRFHPPNLASERQKTLQNKCFLKIRPPNLGGESPPPKFGGCRLSGGWGVGVYEIWPRKPCAVRPLLWGELGAAAPSKCPRGQNANASSGPQSEAQRHSLEPGHQQHPRKEKTRSRSTYWQESVWFWF